LEDYPARADQRTTGRAGNRGPAGPAAPAGSREAGGSAADTPDNTSLYDLPDEELERLVANARAIASQDRLVAHPTRQAILLRLLEDSNEPGSDNGTHRGVGYKTLQDLTYLSIGGVAAHLHRLEEAGYVLCDKHFVDRKPETTFHITSLGREMLKETHARKMLAAGRSCGPGYWTTSGDRPQER